MASAHLQLASISSNTFQAARKNAGGASQKLA
jgi:hypothetical protein